MATKELVTKVWIDPGCIVCDACETTCPDVFEVLHDDDTCVIRPEALEAEFNKPRTDTIVEAAEECPVDVIKFETVSIEVADEPAPASPAEAAPVAAASEGAAPAAKGAPAKPAGPPRPKELDPAIQALLAATTARGGHVVIHRDLSDLPLAVQRLSKLSPDQLPPDARFQRVLEKSKPDTGKPSRRDVVLGVGWASFAAGIGASPMVTWGRCMMPNVLEEPDPQVRCGPVARYEAMGGGEENEDFKMVKTSGCWIVREEEWLGAVSSSRTHRGCGPNWLPNDKKFKCPCHGSGYTYNGVNFEGPTPRPVERFKIYVEGGEVIVDRSRKFLAMGPNDLAVWKDPDASIPV